MFPRRWFPVVTSILLSLVGSRAAAQQRPAEPVGQPVTPPIYNATPTLQLTIFSGPKTRLDRQALIRVENKLTQAVVWQTTQSEGQAIIGDLPVGRYDIEVSAAGYITAHQDVFVASAFSTYHFDIILKPDPAAVDLSKPIGEMPSRARKETVRGVAALKAGDLREAQKRLDAAQKQAPDNPEVQFLLGYLFFQRRDLEPAKTHLTSATKLDARNYQGLILLGRIDLQQHNFTAASTVLEQAVAVDRAPWLGHKLLAEAYLMQYEFEKARQQAQMAIDRGQGAAASAQLISGQALANLGRDQEALSALKGFLQETPETPLASEVRELMAQLEARGKAAGAGELASLDVHRPPLFESSPGSKEVELSAKSWEPRSVDDVKPKVASGVTCPYDELIEKSGQRMKELVDDVARFTAIEELQHEDLDELGHPRSREGRKFNYLVEISETEPGYLGVDEYRTGYGGRDEFPQNIATRGVPALALVFHPTLRGNYQLDCEGLGEWRGRAAWLVHFRQRDDRPSRLHAYKVGPNFYSVNLKGRAWIAADKFQIMRIESDLVSPMPEIQLLTEHQIVEYGPVQFPKKQTELWLPKNAELYFHFRRHRYLRRHSFDHFMLFAVESQEKHKEPKEEN